MEIMHTIKYSMRGDEDMKRLFGVAGFKGNRLKTAVCVALRVVTAATLVFSLLRGQWENSMTCLLTLALLFAPVFVERKMKIMLPTAMELVMVAFVFAANIMGEISAMYERLPLFDTALHTINGFICAGVGFGLTDILNRNQRIRLSLSPLFVCLFSFCFSMTAGTVWEFFEFFMDVFFSKDMQKDSVVHSINSKLLGDGMVSIKNITEASVNGRELGAGGYLDIGLYDTMKDLLVNFAGAAVFDTAGWFYLKGRGKAARVIRNFIPRKKDGGAGSR